MLERMIDALCEQFAEDPSTPSVVLSKLKNGQYYGSLVRYTEAFGQGKQVLYKTMEPTLDEVFAALGTQLGLTQALPDVEVNSIPQL